VWHYVTDHLGTPQEMYDQDGEIVWAADFSAYGLTARSLAQEVDNPIRFPGQYHDEESGLHYNRFRYYDPQVGRYVNQDPIGVIGGINTYAYVRNLPTRRADPLGLYDMAAFFNMHGVQERVSLGKWLSENGASPDEIAKALVPPPRRPIATAECRASGTLALGTGGSIGVAVNEKTGLSGQASVPMIAAGARAAASCGLKFGAPNAKALPAAAGIGFSFGVVTVEVGQTSTWPELYIGVGPGVGPELKAPVAPSVSVPLL